MKLIEKDVTKDELLNMICAIWADLKGITDRMTDKRRARVYEAVLAFPVLHERIPLKNNDEQELFSGLLIIQEYNNKMSELLRNAAVE